jgi:hypothetical protein
LEAASVVATFRTNLIATAFYQLHHHMTMI